MGCISNNWKYNRLNERITMTEYKFYNTKFFRADTKEELEKQIQQERELQQDTYRRIPELFNEFEEIYLEHYSHVGILAFKEIILSDEGIHPKDFLLKYPEECRNLTEKRLLNQLMHETRELFRFYLILRDEYYMSTFFKYDPTYRGLRNKIHKMKG